MYIVKDLVADSSVNLQYTIQGLLAYGQIDRSFVVAEIDTDISDPQLFTSAAVQKVQSVVPENDPHPSYPQLLARAYKVRSIMSHNSVQVMASYVYDQIPGDTTIWQIESSAEVEMLETDQEYDDHGNLIQVKVDNFIKGWGTYQNSSGGLVSPPTGEKPQIPSYGTVLAPKKYKRWDYTRQIRSAQSAMTFDRSTLDFIGKINSEVYRGTTQGATAQNLSLPKETVYCDDAGITLNPYTGEYIAKCVLVYKPQGWQPWVRYLDPITGIAPSNIWRPGKLGSTSYPANGTRQANEFEKTDLNNLLSLLTG